jgi:hypothetical protein
MGEQFSYGARQSNPFLALQMTAPAPSILLYNNNPQSGANYKNGNKQQTN